MVDRALDANWVERFARSPAQSTNERASSLHQNVRALLGENDYDTILQGSYRTGTALADINDVDVLAIRRGVTLRSLKWGQSITWTKFFDEIEKHLESSPSYAGKWRRQDKCVRLETGIHIDIVPAIACDEPTADPIVIYSLSTMAQKNNWPRGHYEKSAAKSASTNGNYKPVVRLFKRWAKCNFSDTKIAPSYYLQCLLYSLPDATFTGDLALDFISAGRTILERHGVPGGYSFKKLPRIAGEGNLFTDDEWDSDPFDKFEAGLRASLPHAVKALAETDPERAKASWRLAFAGFDG